MNAPRHAGRSPRGASLFAALALSLLCGTGCVRSSGGTHGSGGSRAEDASGRAVSAAGSRAIRVLDERCQSRAPGKVLVPPSTAPSAVVGKVVQKANACVEHADCAARPYGRCVARAEQTSYYHGNAIIVPAHTECLYDECTSDAECRAHGQYEPRAELVCQCDLPERHTCTFANCRSDADCPPPYTCGGYHYCHSAGDECHKPGDCQGGRACTYSWEKKLYLCVARQAPPPG